MLLLVQQSKLSDLQDSSASSTTFSLLRQFWKGFNHMKLVLDKALLNADKLKPSSCHRNRTNSFYPLVFMYLHIYLFCLYVMYNKHSSKRGFRQFARGCILRILGDYVPLAV
jgi:hypothetical protein